METITIKDLKDCYNHFKNKDSDVIKQLVELSPNERYNLYKQVEDSIFQNNGFKPMLNTTKESEFLTRSEEKIILAIICQWNPIQPITISDLYEMTNFCIKKISYFVANLKHISVKNGEIYLDNKEYYQNKLPLQKASEMISKYLYD